MSGYRDSLASLAGAVGSGMDPSTAYGIYQNLMGQHSSAVAARKERIGGLIDLITQGGMSGMPSEQMQMLLSAQSGGNIPPRVDAAMESIYPAPEQSPGQAIMGYQNGGYQSPLYQGPSTEEQIAQAQLEGIQAEGAALTAEGEAAAAMAPGIARAWVGKAKALMMPHEVKDEITGVIETKALTGDQVRYALSNHPSFTDLPMEQRALVWAAVEQVINAKNAAIQQSAQRTMTAGQAVPTVSSKPTPSVGTAPYNPATPPKPLYG